MSYGTCNACGSDDCEGYDACTIRSLRAEVVRLRLVLEEITQCGCEACHAQARAALTGKEKP